MAIIWEISESIRLQQEILELYDSLTGLYNQRGFALLAKQKIHEAIRLEQKIVVLLFDIARTGWINQRFGYAEGNVALSTVGCLLRATYRASDIVGHLGGDKFAVLGLLIGNPTMEILTNRFLGKLNAYNVTEEKPYHLSVKIQYRTYQSNADQRQLDILDYISLQNATAVD